jgi:hypothetical protein
MKIQTAIITITIVLMVILFVTASTTFSFAVKTNTTHSQSTANNTTTKTGSSQITTRNPVAHTALTSGTDPCTNTGDTVFYWDHVYGVEGRGTDPWNRPQAGYKADSRLITKTECITVTGNVSSQIGSGTTHDPDGDLHFTLLLDPPYTKYSTPNDCKPTTTGCKNILVEVICHKPSLAYQAGYFKTWGDYCKDVDHSRIPLSGSPNGPPYGQHLSVSGRYVLDKENGNWGEIHPAINIHDVK